MRRGRPRNLERRKAILNAAERLFATSAFHGARMCEIAAAAGIGDTLLYRYFPSKVALVQALAERAIEAYRTFVANVERSFGDGPFTPARLNEFGLEYALFVSETYHLRSCRHAMPAQFRATEADISGARERTQRLVESMFAGLGHRWDDARAKSAAYLYALEGYATEMARLRLEGDPPLERYVAATSDLFTAH